MPKQEKIFEYKNGFIVRLSEWRYKIVHKELGVSSFKDSAIGALNLLCNAEYEYTLIHAKFHS